MTAYPPKGFVALLPVLMIGTALLSLAAAAGEDAYHLRLSVLHGEYAASADAAARSCAGSVLLRLDQGASIASEEVQLDGGMACRIESVELVDDQYRVNTSAKVGNAQVQWQTDAYLDQGKISRVTSRKI